MADTSVPMGFGGGLTRFKEEYNSKLKFSPSVVVLMIIAVIIFRIAIKYIL
jgi:preprotein translocase subunit Sec61beta